MTTALEIAAWYLLGGVAALAFFLPLLAFSARCDEPERDDALTHNTRT